ncbi:DUF6631 family protein, partial [Stenotrophomonas sp. PS02298]|uniref:DUF6631 family protein n=1 Tax=Stenotrophomonas sp. PS02298 TaxID=2991424 RepID=UPI002499B5A8
GAPRPPPRPPPPAAPRGRGGTPILNPDITLPINGERVTVREYSFFEAMDVVYADRGFLDDCVVILAAPGQDPWEAVRALVGKHRTFLVGAIATSCERTPAWVMELPPKEQDRLFSTWWAVNGHFFLQEAALVLRSRNAAASRSTGTLSSATSPAPASTADASPDLAAAPGGNLN